MLPDFRFGVNLTATGDRGEWAAKCRRAEELGFDVILVPDHLGMPAPFPGLLLAAEVTTRPRVGTFVLNTAFYNPVLLARDVLAVDRYTGGRLELGLGAGYVRAEFEQAGIVWPSARERVDHLTRTVEVIAEQAPTTLLVGGNGNRVLRLAATRADIVAFAGLRAVEADPPLALLTASELDERVEFVRAAAGDRVYESNLLIQQVLPTDDRRAAIAEFQAMVPTMTIDDLLDLPYLLVGTHEEIAAQLRANRQRYGFSYITVLEDWMENFAPVIDLLR